MTNGHGGRRSGAGRRKGAKAEVTNEAIRRAGEGETPLEYMLRIMRDEREADDRRDKMAIGAAPYMHAKAVEVTGADGADLFEGIQREIVRAKNPPANG